VPVNGGVYLYGASGFPTKTFQASNYWVDVVLDSTPPAVVAFSPVAGASNVASNATVIVTFSETLSAQSVTANTVFLRNASNATVPASLSYDPASKTVTLTPGSSLAASSTYTIVVKGGGAGIKDAAGNALLADVTASFTTL